MALAQSSAAQKEVSTAHAHALMARGSQSLKMSHTHLHHVVNCLVGPKGEGFDAKAGNPCKGMGQGALPNSQDDQALHSRLNKALGAAQQGLKTSKLKASQSDAAKAANLLETDTGGATDSEQQP
jgi:hypothetical protein